MNEILDMLAVSWFLLMFIALVVIVFWQLIGMWANTAAARDDLMWSRKPPRPVRRTTSHARTANRRPAVRSPQSLKNLPGNVVDLNARRK